MALPRSLEDLRTLERGSIRLLHRSRVEPPDTDKPDDVQRILLLLAPEGSPFERLIVVGRHRSPGPVRHERFWGFVDLVLTSRDMSATLEPQVYATDHGSLRQLPGARTLASGNYSLEWHDTHAHLRWSLHAIDGLNPIARDLALEDTSDLIITIANPDPSVWGLEEVPNLQAELFDDLETHVQVPASYPRGLQQRFEGRRFAELDATEWLDHPGVELVFTGAVERSPRITDSLRAQDPRSR